MHSLTAVAKGADHRAEYHQAKHRSHRLNQSVFSHLDNDEHLQRQQRHQNDHQEPVERVAAAACCYTRNSTQEEGRQGSRLGTRMNR